MSEVKRKRVTTRTGERLCRAAYEYEALAAVLREEGYDSIAGSLREISSQLGKCGRALLERLEARP
jgi:hypothetical protein